MTFSELGSNFKNLTYSVRRWVQLTSLVEQVNGSVNELLVKQTVNLKLYRLEGNSTYRSQPVDLRELYYHPTKGVSPTKLGIALRINKWITLKDVMQKLLLKYPLLAPTTPCMYEPNGDISVNEIKK